MPIYCHICDKPINPLESGCFFEPDLTIMTKKEKDSLLPFTGNFVHKSCIETKYKQLVSEEPTFYARAHKLLGEEKMYKDKALETRVMVENLVREHDTLEPTKIGDKDE